MGLLSMTRSWLKERKNKLTLTSSTGLALIFLIVVLVNLISQAAFVRFDLTADRSYSLSDASLGLLRSLPDPVIIRAFLSDGLPQPYGSYEQYIRDVLAEYRARSGGKVRLEFLNPDRSDKIRSAANTAGLMSVRFQQLVQDEFTLREGYVGLVLNYQDQQKVIPFIKDTAGLEYAITSRILAMVQPAKKEIGFSTGHGEFTPASQGRAFVEALEERYGIVDVSLREGATSWPSLSALLVVSPRNAFTEKEVRALDDFVARGIPVSFFVSRRSVFLQSFTSVVANTGLDGLFENYGLRMDPEFVIDAQCQRISLNMQENGMQIANIINYPFIPVSSDLSETHPLVRDFGMLSFPFATPLHPAATAQADIRFIPLARSSPRSWQVENQSIVNPYKPPPPPEKFGGPYVLAAVSEGSATSYSDKDRPVEKFRLAVIGSSAFLDPSIPVTETNIAFLMNLIDWSVQEEALIAIRSKGSIYRPLRPVPPVVKTIYKALSVFSAPGLVLLAGFLYWRRRKEWRAEAERRYGGISDVG